MEGRQGPVCSNFSVSHKSVHDSSSEDDEIGKSTADFFAFDKPPALAAASTEAKSSFPKQSLKRSLSSIQGSTPDDALSKQEVVDLLKAGPIRTKDLIYALKAKLRANESNKMLLREYVKEVATVRGASASSEEEKLLELKQKYKQL